MSRPAPYILQRRPVYIGCEGQSEVSYSSFLQDLLRDAGLPVHLVVQDLGPGAGDPLARVSMAVRNLEHLRKKRFAPDQRFMLLDFDQADRNPQRANLAKQMAAANQIVIVWQRPCFEALLLRHLEGCQTRQPPGTPEAAKALLKEWPEYKKPMLRGKLAKRIDKVAVVRAASVEPELDALLSCLGLI